MHSLALFFELHSDILKVCDINLCLDLITFQHHLLFRRLILSRSSINISAISLSRCCYAFRWNLNNQALSSWHARSRTRTAECMPMTPHACLIYMYQGIYYCIIIQHCPEACSVSFQTNDQSDHKIWSGARFDKLKESEQGVRVQICI